MKATRLEKQLGLWDVFALCTGAMFSSGFFLLPGIAAADAGPSVVLAYVLAGILVIPAMLSVAELSTAMPRAGGAYYFMDRALGPAFGAIGGMGSWLALVLKSAFALVGIGAYLSLIVALPIRPVAVVLVLIFAVVNVVGAKETASLQRRLVWLLLGTISVWVVFGLGAWFVGGSVAPDPRGTLAGGWEGVIATSGLVFVSYAGLTKVASVAEEVENPDRNIPLGMGLSLLVATLVYAVGVAIVVALVPSPGLHTDLTPIATASRTAFGPFAVLGVGVVVIAAMAAFASTGNAGLMSSSRYPLAMARDGLAPKVFGEIGRYGTPALSVVLTATLMIAIILTLDVSALAKAASAFQLALFGFLHVCVIVMRESRIPFYKPGFQSPFYPWVQIAGVIIPVVLIAQMGWFAVAATLGAVLLSLAWYGVYAWGKVDRTGAILHVFARLGRRASNGVSRELREIFAERTDEKLRNAPFAALIDSAIILDIEDSTIEDALRLGASEAAGGNRQKAAPWARALVEEAHLGLVPSVNGVALPHLEVADVQGHRLVALRIRAGLQIPAPGGRERVHAVLMLISSHQKPGEHLRHLAALAGAAEQLTFLPAWIDANTERCLQTLLLAPDAEELAA